MWAAGLGPPKISIAWACGAPKAHNVAMTTACLMRLIPFMVLPLRCGVQNAAALHANALAALYRQMLTVFVRRREVPADCRPQPVKGDPILPPSRNEPRSRRVTDVRSNRDREWTMRSRRAFLGIIGLGPALSRSLRGRSRSSRTIPPRSRRRSRPASRSWSMCGPGGAFSAMPRPHPRQPEERSRL